MKRTPAPLRCGTGALSPGLFMFDFQNAKEKASENDLCANDNAGHGRDRITHHALGIQIAEGSVFPCLLYTSRCV